MNGGDDKKHLDTLGVLLVDDYVFLGDMEDRWREHLNRGNGETMVFSHFFEYLNHVFKLIKVSGFDFPFKSFIPSWLSPCQLPCQLP